MYVAPERGRRRDTAFRACRDSPGVSMRDNFDRLFRSGELPARVGDHEYQMWVDALDVGRLRLPTGRLVARDVTWDVPDPNDVGLGFVQTVDPGEYQVILSVMQAPQSLGGDRRVAAAKLQIRSESASSWEVAICPDYEVPDGEDPAEYGFGLDHLGCYLDFSALEFLESQRTSDRMYDAHSHVWEAASRSCELMDRATGLNIILFQCGFGAGAYTTWVGRNVHGAITGFVSDFAVVAAWDSNSDPGS